MTKKQKPKPRRARKPKNDDKHFAGVERIDANRRKLLGRCLQTTGSTRVEGARSPGEQLPRQRLALQRDGRKSIRFRVDMRRTLLRLVNSST